MRVRRFFALLASLLFLLHPIQVESVVYIAGLQEPLFFFFGMLALLVKPWLFRLSFLLLALLSKETGIIFVLVMPFYDWASHKREFWRSVLPIISLPIYLFLRFGVARLQIMEHDLTPINRLSLLERVPMIPSIIVHYFADIIAPFRLSISEHWIIENINWQSAALPLVVVIAVFMFFIYLVYRTRDRQEEILFWFVLIILSVGLHLHFIPLDFTTSDRWIYLPLAGVAGFLAIIMPRKTPIERIVSSWQFVLVGSYFAVLLVVSYMRIGDWESGYNLYQKDILKSPNSFDLNNNLGVELYRNNQVGSAKRYFLRSTELAPYWWTNWNNYGVTLESEGKYEEALASYKKSIDNGSYYLAIENYAKLLYRLGRKEEAKEFATSYLKVLPNNITLNELATTL